MEKLKPCPFCGAEKPELHDSTSIGYWYKCRKCHTDGPPSDSPEAVVEAWNTRAETEVEPEDVQQVMDSVREVFALSPLIAVRLWVAPTITGRLWIFTEQPTVRGELSWLNDGDRYPWTEALFGISPVRTWGDDPVEIEVSWRVIK